MPTYTEKVSITTIEDSHARNTIWATQTTYNKLPKIRYKRRFTKIHLLTQQRVHGKKKNVYTRATPPELTRGLCVTESLF